MTSLSLACPLCCNEAFSSHDSLKQHLLDQVKKLICPVCKQKFQSVVLLAEHVGKPCKTPQNVNAKIVKKEISEEQEDMNYPMIKKEIEEEVGQNDPIMQIDSSDVQQDEQEQHINNEHNMYTCQMCEISFNSVEEHLEKYHQGEEVFLETDENEVLEIDDSTTQNSENEDSECIYIYNDGESTTEDNCTVNESVQTNSSEIQHFLDKNGQTYTRKCVKIEKFWEDRDPPVVDKYIVENGNIRQITEEEAKTTNKDIIEIHKCPKCHLQFPQKEHYLKHICKPKKTKTPNKDLSKALKYVCHYCRRDFQNVEELATHLKTHVRVEGEPGRRKVVTLGPHTCEICNTTFPTFKSLRLHERMHEPVKLKQLNGTSSELFDCEICNTSYDVKYEEIHMASHLEREDFDCPTCNKKFFTKENLEMHLKAHSNGKKFSCSYCKKAFTNQIALQSHTENECKERQYECQYCGRKFSRPHEKVKHERIHTGEKPHICQLCGKAFRVSYCLTLHLRTHTGNRPYECKVCGKRFKSHGVYNHHMQTHSDVRKYKCPFCPKAFKTSVQLAGHKNSHTKPFTCTECNRPFASLYAVRAHMATHIRGDNNLKYDCWLCGATYARQFALRDHMRTQHAAQIIEEQEVVQLEESQDQNEIIEENQLAEYEEVEQGEEDAAIGVEHEQEEMSQEMVQEEQMAHHEEMTQAGETIHETEMVAEGEIAHEGEIDHEGEIAHEGEISHKQIVTQEGEIMREADVNQDENVAQAEEDQDTIGVQQAERHEESNEEATVIRQQDEVESNVEQEQQEHVAETVPMEV